MKNKFKMISIILIVLCIGVIIYYNNSSGKYSFKQKDVKYALTLDGNKIDSYPSKGVYRVDVTCEGADGRWLYDDWKLVVENVISDNVSCNINFKTIDKTYLNEYIIGLAGNEQGTGQVVNERGYRYEGKNPNNYIWFNNEYWRIIGVFDSTSHGQGEKNLVKIIRADLLGNLSWNKTNQNDWTAASLKSILNGAYYNAEDGTDSGYCYGYGASVISNCDYTVRGIQSSYREMIANVKWYLNGYSNINANVVSFYLNERGSLNTTAYIGLMYPSDYGFSVLESSCSRKTNMNSYNNESCAGSSWLYGNGQEWTITLSSSNSTDVFYLMHNGSYSYSYTARNGYGVRPVLYLSDSVYKIDGDGSLENPYIIGM